MAIGFAIEARHLSVLENFQTGSVTLQFSYSKILVALPLAVKRMGREADHLPYPVPK